jgi:phosphate-selective porin OprO/OprP
MLAGFDDGIFLRSADGKYNVRITGQLQSDYRAFLDGHDQVDVDSFLVRRARLGIEADMLKYYEFRLLPDFSNKQGATPSTVNPLLPPTTATAQTVILDAYINVHYWDAFQIEAGKFKQPFSYEQLIQDRFVPTLERSLIDQVVPSRDPGVMVHGQKLLGNRLDYYLAVCNGGINTDYDTNDQKDFVWRVVVRPFNSDGFWPILRGLQIGMDGTTGLQREAQTPQVLRTPATIPWLAFNNGVLDDGVRNRWSPEVAYFYGPLGLAAQYFRMDEDMRSAPGGNPLIGVPVHVPFEGGYVLATLLLTGETRTTYSQPITPLHDFDPCSPWSCRGAWELVARYSRLDVSNIIFAPGVRNLATLTSATVLTGNPGGQSTHAASELTLGFNWYLNKWVRMQFNYERSWYDTPIRLGVTRGGLLTHDDALLSRFQLIF